MRLRVPTPYATVGIFLHDGSSLPMREKCPHVVRTWPWVILYLKMMRFPVQKQAELRRRRLSSWFPGLSGICSRSRSPSRWSLHPSVSNQWPPTIFHPPLLKCYVLLLQDQDRLMDQSILMLFTRETKDTLQQWSVLGLSLLSSIDFLQLSSPAR